MKRHFYSANGTDNDDGDNGSMIGHIFARQNSNAVGTYLMESSQQVSEVGIFAHLRVTLL